MNSTQLDRLAQHIDLDDLMARCLGNLQFAERILTIFQGRCESDMVELDRAVTDSNLDQVKLIAHRLKGACASAGALALSDRAAQMWKVADEGQMDELVPRLAQLRTQWDECASNLSPPPSVEGAAADSLREAASLVARSLAVS